MSEELKPCPFCNAKHAHVFKSNDEHGNYSFGVQCSSSHCSVCGPERGTESDAVESWNRRTPAEPAPAGTGLSLIEYRASADDVWHSAPLSELESLVKDGFQVRAAPVAARELGVEAERREYGWLDAEELEALRNALSWMGESTPESLEEVGIEQRRLVRRLIRAVVEHRDATYAAQSTAPVSTASTDLSAAVLRTMYEAFQRGDSVERAHAAVMAAIGSPVSTEQAGDAWISVEDRLPGVLLNDNRQFIIACRRGRNGKTYVFAADYLNARELHNDEDGAVALTGWYTESEHPEYNGWFEPVCQVGDEVTHWMPLPAAPSPNNSPVGADRRE